jgi:hypothetical protein
MLNTTPSFYWIDVTVIIPLDFFFFFLIIAYRYYHVSKKKKKKSGGVGDEIG